MIIHQINQSVETEILYLFGIDDLGSLKSPLRHLGIGLEGRGPAAQGEAHTGGLKSKKE